MICQNSHLGHLYRGTGDCPLMKHSRILPAASRQENFFNKKCQMMAIPEEIGVLSYKSREIVWENSQNLKLGVQESYTKHLGSNNAGRRVRQVMCIPWLQINLCNSIRPTFSSCMSINAICTYVRQCKHHYFDYHGNDLHFHGVTVPISSKMNS